MSAFIDFNCEKCGTQFHLSEGLNKTETNTLAAERGMEAVKQKTLEVNDKNINEFMKNVQKHGWTCDGKLIAKSIGHAD